MSLASFKSSPAKILSVTCFVVIGSGMAFSGAAMVRGDDRVPKAIWASLRRQHTRAAVLLFSFWSLEHSSFAVFVTSLTIAGSLIVEEELLQDRSSGSRSRLGLHGAGRRAQRHRVTGLETEAIVLRFSPYAQCSKFDRPS